MAESQVAGIVKRANEMFGKGQFPYAISLFKQALLVDLNSADAHRGLALAAQKQLQANGGIGKLKAQALTLKTQGLLKAIKDAKKKSEICFNHLVDDPNNEKIRLELARALEEAKAVDGAILEAGMAVEINPKSFEALKFLGMMLQRRGKPDDIMRAQGCLEEANRINPTDRETFKALRDLAAQLSMAKSGLDKAKDYRDTLKDSKKAAELERKGQMIRTDEQFLQEVESVKKEMAANPKDPKIPRRLGDLYFEVKKDYDTAAQWYQKGSDLAPQDTTYRDKVDDCKIRKYEAEAAKLKEAGDPREKELRAEKLKFEIESFERRVKDRPTDPLPKFQLGQRYLLAGLLDKGVAQFQQSVKDPKLATDSRVFLGRCFVTKKMYDMADQQYEMAEKAGFVPPDKLREIWYQRAKCKAESGNFAAAMEFGKKIMAEDIGFRDISQLVEQWSEQIKT
jgi:tetratricopeptide (TPR) repeat protein